MNDAPVELEIRFVATPAALASLARARAFRDLVVSPLETTELVSRYWDSPDLAFLAARTAVRARREGDGGRWLQTIKTEHADPHQRYEFEISIDGEEPVLAAAVALGWKAPQALLSLDGALRPLFTTVVKRGTRRLTFPDGTLAELAIDRGSLRLESAPERDEPLCEIEIELLEGDVRRVYELGYALVSEITGLRLTLSSKAERGYRLLTGKAAAPREARALRPERRRRAGMLAVDALTEALAHFEANVEGARAGTDPGYVHQMRVGMRRLRVANSMARAADLPTFSEALLGELKWLWQRLGTARDWDVFEHTTWTALQPAVDDADAASAFAARVSVASRASRQAVRRALDSRRIQRMRLALAWVLAHQRSAATAGDRRHDGVARLARKLLARRMRRLLHHESAVHRAVPSERHRLRIEAKKLRYLAHYVADAKKQRSAGRFLRRLAALQRVLGRLNDLNAADRAVQSAVGRKQAQAPAIVRAWASYRAQTGTALEHKLGRAWKRFAATPPFWD